MAFHILTHCCPSLIWNWSGFYCSCAVSRLHKEFWSFGNSIGLIDRVKLGFFLIIMLMKEATSFFFHTWFVFLSCWATWELSVLLYADDNVGFVFCVSTPSGHKMWLCSSSTSSGFINYERTKAPISTTHQRSRWNTGGHFNWANSNFKYLGLAFFLLRGSDGRNFRCPSVLL